MSKVAALALCLLGLGLAEAGKPHIVFMVADDLGWNDVGYNNPDIISPNIDSLAASGVTLTQSYVQPLCSPSRSAFMTGAYPFTMGLSHMAIAMRQAVCVPLDKHLLPQILKQNGYATHAIGKWHLGFCNWNCTPTYRGFDSFYGYYNGMEDYYTKQIDEGYDFRDNTNADLTANGTYSSFQFGARAKSIIQNHDSDTPLFLYLPFQNVHSPLEVPVQYENMYNNIENKDRRLFSGMVTAMDDVIGQVVQELKDNGLYDNTIIAFSSDNGGMPTSGGNNYPLRGGKMTIFEGGTRVPGFVHSPLLNQTGVEFEGLMHAVDWFPTFIEAAGINYTDNSQDGVSQWEALNYRANSTRTEIVYNLDFDQFALEGRAGIRMGDYKLIDGFPGPFGGWYTPSNKSWTSGDEEYPMCKDLSVFKLNNTAIAHLMSGPVDLNKFLFNVKEDPSERHNLYNKMPEKVAELKSRLEQYEQRYVTANYPDSSPEADPSNYGGIWTPGWC